MIGSDAAGVVLRIGSAVRNWKPGDGVTVRCTHGGIPVCVVSSPDKADILRNMGVDAIIDRRAVAYQFWKDAARTTRVSGVAWARTSAI